MPITKGDQISASIAAASIIAKVHRDKIMQKLSDQSDYFKYHIDKSKGYGTKAHLAAIKRYGPSKIHRLGFIGIDKRTQTVLNLNKDNKKGVL